MTEQLPFSTTLEVRDGCLCLHLQRSARVLARRFDEAFKPFELSNGQFSLLMSLNRPHPPRHGELVPLLAMDRTTLTANLKPLERRGLVESIADPEDRRARRLALTPEGRALLVSALPVWRDTHKALEVEFPAIDLQRMRNELAALSQGKAEPVKKPAKSAPLQ